MKDMAHYGLTATREKPKSDEDWLFVGSRVGKLVNLWADRNDLIAYVSEIAGSEAGAPASFNPKSAEVEVNTHVAFGYATPFEVGDLTERTRQFEFPKATGAIFHEAMHARFTKWDLEKAARELSSGVFAAMHLLEEGRIERLGVLTNPENKVFLRACALEIVLADMQDEDIAKLSSTRQAAHALALTLGRVDAQVLEEVDIETIMDQIQAVLSQEKIEAFQKIWREFQMLTEYSLERMYALAEEWHKLVEETAEENGEPQQEQQSQMSVNFAEELLEAIEDAADISGIRVSRAVDEQQMTEEFAEQAEQMNSKASEKREHEEKASQVFGSGLGPGANTSSQLVSTRKPTADERRSAVKIAQQLEKAQYQDRVRIAHSSSVPPGRLRTRALVQGAALREKNIVASVEPFKRIQRKHVDDPNLTIGVMVDISGSMNSAMEPLGSAAWILSEATRRVSGKVAMTYYGDSVFPTLKPGQHLPEVRVYSALDRTEKFDSAFQAMNGALNLLDGSGARLLVIVSDGEYRNHETLAARKWIDRCRAAGVGVLWIGAGRYGETGRNYCEKNGAVFTRMKDSATGVAKEIGIAAAKALTQAGNAR